MRNSLVKLLRRLIIPALMITAFLASGAAVQAQPHRHGPQEPERHRPRAPERHAPHIGSHVKKLPRGCARVHHHRAKRPHYYHRGVFYRESPWGFTVVSPPLGAIVLSLPLGCTTVTFGHVSYFHDGCAYYQRVPNGYKVVEPPALAAAPSTAYGMGERVRVAADRLNVREGPGKDFAVTAVVVQGTGLKVMGGSPGWVYVKLASGRFGWVMQAYVTPSVAPAAG